MRSGKLELDRSVQAWCDLWLESGLVREAAISAKIAEMAGSCAWSHRDPADRLIVASAMVLEVPLVTHDVELRKVALGLVDLVL